MNGNNRMYRGDSVQHVYGLPPPAASSSSQQVTAQASQLSSQQAVGASTSTRTMTTTTASNTTMTSQRPLLQHQNSRSRMMVVQQEKSPQQLDDEYQKEWVKQASRRIHEHVFFMRKAMEADDLSVTLDRASAMLTELGDPSTSTPHNSFVSHNSSEQSQAPVHPLNPKSYYELHMRALEEMPNLEELFVSIVEDYCEDVDYDGLKERKMKELYEAVQYCPKVVPRLYLQICAGSAILRQHPQHASTYLQELTQAVKCVQCPTRGLFLRHYLLQATRENLPADSHEFVLTNFIEMNKLWVRLQHLPPPPPSDRTAGSKEELRLAMRQARKKREKERNELRLLVGTNLERLASLEGLTPEMYQQQILPTILDQISACRDALAQAYLMDCIIQVFPDEFHIPTLELILSVCPKLREKVNVRTILTAIMERLANYYADEALLDQDDDEDDEEDDDEEEVDGARKEKQAQRKERLEEAYQSFKRCIQAVFDARGPNMPSKEIIRLQTSLLNFSLRCDDSNMEHVSECLGTCVSRLEEKELDAVAVEELEKLLSIPLDTLALKVLSVKNYSDLLTFLPWNNRRHVAIVMLKAVHTSNTIFTQIHPITQLFQIITPLIQSEHASHDRTAAMEEAETAGSGSGEEGSFFPTMSSSSKRLPATPELTAMMREEHQLLSTVVHLLQSDDVDTQLEMYQIARSFFAKTHDTQIHTITLPPLLFSLLHLIERVMTIEFSTTSPQPDKQDKSEQDIETAINDETIEQDKAEEETQTETEKQIEAAVDEETDEQPTTTTQVQQVADNQVESSTPAEAAPNVTCRKLFVFIQKTMAMMASTDAEPTFKLYLQVAATADRCAQHCPDNKTSDFSTIAYELMAQAFTVYEEEIADSKTQQRALISIIGTLLSCTTLDKSDYEALITKTAQYAAKLLKKADQCKMVMLCSHLFFTGTEDDPNAYRNPQRVLECLQRSLKIADACTMASPTNVQLFVDVLDRYVYYYEMNNPVISSNFVTGLIALVSEHLDSIGADSSGAIQEANHHFRQIVQYILMKKNHPATAERFEAINC